jgi:hypothetical protein
VSGSTAPNGVLFTQTTDYATSAREIVDRPMFRRHAIFLAGFDDRPDAWLTSSALWPYLRLLLFYLWPSFLPFTLAPYQGITAHPHCR